MVQLFLNGLPAILKTDASIKLTKENVYFTKSASYTYEVELPLDIPENLRNFGWIQRIDVEKEVSLLEATLMVDNVTVLVGTAHATQVTEASVKVQLLGESASYNYGNKAEKIYIDKLDMGNWYFATWPDGSYWVPKVNDNPAHWGYHTPGSFYARSSSQVLYRASFNSDGESSPEIQLENIFSGNYPWVVFPTYSASEDVTYNNYIYQFTNDKFTQTQFRFLGREGSGTNLTAIQPYVWFMAELIAKATGFTLERESNALYTNPFFRRIFIVNSNTFIDCNKCLPHWTVNEWWENIENAFGLVMTVNYESRRITLRQRSDHYSTDTGVIELRHVVDEYTVDLGDDTQTDISASNVGFADHDSDPADILSEYINEHATVNKQFSSLTELRQWACNQSESTLKKSKGTIFKCEDGHQFIYTEAYGLIEVNMFRPRIVNPENEDIELELKFVPAQFIEDECKVFRSDENNESNTSYVALNTPVATFPVKILCVPDGNNFEDNEEIDIEGLISGEVEEGDSDESKPDIIYMAIANFNHDTHHETLKFSYPEKVTVDGHTSIVNKTVNYYQAFKYPRAYLRERYQSAVSPGSGQPGPVTIEDKDFSLSLISIAGQNNLANNTMSGTVSVGTRKKYCISFVADQIPDVGSVFLIRNKRFVCEKIEATITSKGLDRLLTGYFYRLEL